MLQFRSRALQLRTALKYREMRPLGPEFDGLTARGLSRYFAHSLSSPPSAELIS